MYGVCLFSMALKAKVWIKLRNLEMENFEIYGK